MKCEYYREREKRNLINKLYMQGYCIGTRKMEDCWCDGDRVRCTFYPEYRKEAQRPRMTKAEAEEKFNIRIVEDK